MDEGCTCPSNGTRRYILPKNTLVICRWAYQLPPESWRPSSTVSLSLSLSPVFTTTFSRKLLSKRSVSYLGSPCQRCLADFTAGIKRDENRSTRNYTKGRDKFDFDSFPNARLFCTKLFQPVSLWRRMRRGLEVGGPERWWPVSGDKWSLGSTICSRARRRVAEPRCAEVAPWRRLEDRPTGVLISAALVLVRRALPRWPLPVRESVE